MPPTRTAGTSKQKKKAAVAATTANPPGQDSRSSQGQERIKNLEKPGDKPSYEELFEFQQLVQGYININVATEYEGAQGFDTIGEFGLGFGQVGSPQD